MELVALNSGLLPQDKIDVVGTLYTEIESDFERKTIFRTETEMRISVLNQIHFPDPHSRYWQLVREQQVHFEQLAMLSFDYRKVEVEAKILERDIAKEEDPLNRELLQIELERKHFLLKSQKKVAEERVRELVQCSKLKAEQIKAGGVNTENANIGQLKSYTKAFILEMFNSGNNIGAADAQNIIGKAVTAKNRCKELNLWGEIVAELCLTPEQLKALGA